MDTRTTIIGFDRDGTLELPDKPPPIELIARLGRLERAGVMFFLASGKSMEFLEDYATYLGIKPLLISAENGGHVRIYPDKAEFVLRPTGDLESFTQEVAGLELPPHGPERKVSIWSRKFGAQVEEAAAILSGFIRCRGWALTVFAHPDVDGGLDVVPDGIDKKLLVKHLPKDRVVHYFGDSWNDLGLMRHSRVTPHTVANARQSVISLVKARGGRVATRFAGEGVLDLLGELFNDG